MIVQDSTFVAASATLMPFADAILRVDRKLARAIQTQRGLNLKPAELDLLTLVGAVELVGKARSEIMKEIAQCRNQKPSTGEESFTSTTSAAKMASRPVRTSTSSGTTPTRNGLSDAARTRGMFV